MSALPDSARPRIGRGFRIQWEPAQDAHVLLYPEGLVKLNGSAGAIMSRCDGARTLAEIVADLESTYGATGLEGDVKAFVSLALEKKWLEIDLSDVDERGVDERGVDEPDMDEAHVDEGGIGPDVGALAVRE